MELKLIVALVLALFIIYSTLVNMQSIVRPPASNIEGYSGGYELYVHRRGWKTIKDIHYYNYVWTNQRWKRKQYLRNYHKVYVKKIGWMTYENAKKPVNSTEYEELIKRMSETEKAAWRARIMAADAQSDLYDVKVNNEKTAKQVKTLVNGN